MRLSPPVSFSDANPSAGGHSERSLAWLGPIFGCSSRGFESRRFDHGGMEAMMGNGIKSKKAATKRQASCEVGETVRWGHAGKTIQGDVVGMCTPGDSLEICLERIGIVTSASQRKGTDDVTVDRAIVRRQRPGTKQESWVYHAIETSKLERVAAPKRSKKAA